MWLGCYSQRGFADIINTGKISLESIGQRRCTCVIPSRAEQGLGRGTTIHRGPNYLENSLLESCDEVNKMSTMCWPGYANTLVPWVLQEADGTDHSCGDGSQSQGISPFVCISVCFRRRDSMVAQAS